MGWITYLLFTVLLAGAIPSKWRIRDITHDTHTWLTKTDRAVVLQDFVERGVALLFLVEGP